MLESSKNNQNRVFMKFLGLLILLLSMSSHATNTRTFSCFGNYESTNTGLPFGSLHDEITYEVGQENLNITLNLEDSKALLEGVLKVQNNEELLTVKVTLKDSGFIAFNNNSNLGQPIDGGFNFVSLTLQNIGPVMDNGETKEVLQASFQCQTY